MKEHEMEHVHRVYYGMGDGAFLEVGPDSDGAGCVEIRATDKKSMEFWGEIRLVIDPQFARLLASALRITADEIEPPKPGER